MINVYCGEYDLRENVPKNNIILNCCTMSPSRRTCALNSNLQNELTFIKPTSISPHIVYCEMCKTEFDISNSVRSNITKHIKKQKHQVALNVAASSRKINYCY